MRAVSLTAFLVTAALAGPGARLARAGEDAKAAAPAEVAPRPAASRYQLVEVLPKAKQALVYDRDRGAFVVVRAGDLLGDLTVAAIAKDALSLRPTQGDAKETREYVLYPTPLGEEAEEAAATGDGLVDPYSPEILDPYGTEGVREVAAPPTIREVKAPAAAAPAPTPTPTPPAAPAPAKASPPIATVIAPAVTIRPPTPSPTPSPSPTPTPAGPLTVSRAEIDAAVSDFDKLGRDIDARLGADGVTVSRVAAGSLFHRLGLRAGDRVTAVDGRPIRSLDDAAALYAKLSIATKVSVDVARGTERVTLRLQVTK